VSAPARERPAAARRAAGGPARRAVTRWAWRLFRREWRQQLLVLALLTVAVAATTAGAAVVAESPSSPDATFGTASQLVTLPGTDPRLAADIAAIQRGFGSAQVIAHQAVAVPGAVAPVDLRAQDPAGRYGRPMLRLDAGRYPAGPDQVALTGGVAAVSGLRIGDLWTPGGRARRIVGLVENPENLLDQFALAGPGQVTAPSRVTILFDASPAAVAAFRFPASAAVVARARAPRSSAATTVLALATLGLLFIGLVAVAGFTVLAQRRLRALGMLGALGATDRSVRLVLLANGAVVGAVGSLAGGALGLAGWIAFAPHLETFAEHRIDRLSLPWPTIGTAMALAVLTAVAAAWWPARTAARIPVVAALSGRPPRPRPAHKLAALGGLLLAAGLGFLAFADQNGGIPPLVIAGIVATTAGILLIGPLGIAGLAAAGRRAPIAVRLALRDLARYQARSGAALAAVSLVAGIAATIAIATAQAASQAAQATPAAPNLPASQLIVYLSPGGAGGVIPAKTPAQLQSLQADVTALAATLRARSALALDAPVDPAASAHQAGPRRHRPGGQEQPAGLVKMTSSCPAPAAEYAGQVYVATPPILRAYGIKQADVHPAADLLTSRTAPAGLQLNSAAMTGCGYSSGTPVIAHPVIQAAAALPAGTSDPNTLLTVRALHRLGWRSVPAGWLLQLPRSLTAAQIGAARQSAAAAGLTIETRSAQDSLARLRDWATAAGLLLALGVLAMTVGLIRSETASELRTLTAAGASSVTRRTLTGTTSGALALLGALLGTAVAYLALIAWHRSNLGTMTGVPVASLLIIVAGLPLTAGAGGWLLAGREPPAIARRPLE
jgi:putative ABC transport system permease protein